LIFAPLGQLPGKRLRLNWKKPTIRIFRILGNGSDVLINSGKSLKYAENEVISKMEITTDFK
jgi:hypothetical protein